MLVYITVFVEVAPKRQRPNDSKAKAASVAPTAPPKFSAEAVLQKRRDKNAAQMVRGHFRKVSSKDGRAAFESFQKQLEDPDNAGERMTNVARIVRPTTYMASTIGATSTPPRAVKSRTYPEFANNPNLLDMSTDELYMYRRDTQVYLPNGPEETMPFLINEFATDQGKVETEYASGPFLNLPGTTAATAGVTPFSYTNKWAIPKRLETFLDRKWGGVNFESGYDIYPDAFPQGAKISGALNILSVSKNLLLNPPFDNVIDHLLHWFDVAIKTNTAFILISPVKLDCAQFRFIVTSDLNTVVYFNNPIHFRSIWNGYKKPGPCPVRTCLVFLNMAGNNIFVNNDKDGVFKVEGPWSKQLRGLPNTFSEHLNWSQVRSTVDLFKLQEQQAFDLCQPQMSFEDLLPAVGSTLDTKPFTPLSPLWSTKLSPLITEHFPATYTSVKRKHITLSRSEHLLKHSNGKFLPKTNISCYLCHATDHPTSACFLRIPSCSELGIYARDDRILYQFLTNIFQPFEPVVEIAGESDADTRNRIYALLTLRKKCFRGRVNKYFAKQVPPITFRWHRSEFSQMRNNLDHHAALGKQLWIIIQIAFGIRYPWLRIPDPISVGTTPVIDHELWKIQEKELLKGHCAICPEDFPENLHPLFGLESSDKLRSIHHLRYLNGYLPTFLYQQENLDDFLYNLEPGDLLWFEDMKSCFQQFTLCPKDRRRFGYQFIYKGRKYTVIPNYALFGASLNPFLVKQRFKEEVRILRMLFKNVLLWLDDLNGLIKGGKPQTTTQFNMTFGKALFEDGGTIFGPKGVKWHPVPHIGTLGSHVFAPLQAKRVPGDKVEKLYCACEHVLQSDTTTLQELSSIAGKFLSYGPPISKLYTSELFKVMSRELMHLAFRETQKEIKGDLNYRGVECQPRYYDLTDLSKSPDYKWPTKPDPQQIQYQRDLQHALQGKKVSITFAKIASFKIEASSKKLHHIKIATPQQLELIFANWFAILSKSDMLVKHESLAHWQTAYFVNSDASEIGAGVNVLLQEKGNPKATKILVSQHFAFPPELKSLLPQEGASIIRSSCARETFGLKQSALSLHKTLKVSNLKPLPVFLYTDNLGTAFMFHSKHAQNYITQKYLTETLKLLHGLNQPFEIFWKRRSEPSASSADLASKLPPWRCSPMLVKQITHFFGQNENTTFFYPLEPLDMIRLRVGRVPKGFEKFHNKQSLRKQMLLIVPPNLQKHTYRNIIECFAQFSLCGFLILPHLHNKSWFSPLLQRLGNPLKVDTSPLFFQSTVFETSVQFAFKMAIFKLH